MDPAQQFHLMTNPDFQERETMKEAAYDRLMGAIQSRIAANQEKLTPYYEAVPGSISAEEAVGLRGELTALRGVLAEAEIQPPEPVRDPLSMSNIELAS